MKIKSFFTKENICFTVIQTAYWAGFCILFAYLSPYILSLGCSNTQLGVIISVNSLASIIGQPVFGYICDRSGSIKKVMIGSLLGGSALAAIFYLTGSSYLAILFFSTVISFIIQAVYPLIDNWTVLDAQVNPTTNYGITRGIASLGYAATSAIVGGFFDKHGFQWMFILFIAMMVIAALGCLGPSDTNNSIQKEKVKFTDLKLLATNYGYVAFVVVATLLYVAFRSAHGFLATLMTQVGGSTEQLGYAWSVLGLSEVPALFLAGIILRKMKDSHLLFVSMCFFVLRVLLPSFAVTPTQLIWMTALQGLSYGLFLPASVSFIARITKRELSSTAQTFAVAMYAGVGNTVAGVVGGVLVDSIGVVNVYRIAGIIIAVLAVVFGMVVVSLDKKEKAAQAAAE
ncbi:MAG: MFS transporter [Faecalicatena sp.]|uniref:MFS transporter n=1 Tax=Faecalicatena sp. TaxID=2005360 RepID=UPI002586C6B6|nr:MFS transporter [Faecalicatena sp.]MCI6465535.1 MFS transporter [Faecalicatena sp.]MDY5617367.1 MFS transporter [Lachnospiraceae bacterium]